MKRLGSSLLVGSILAALLSTACSSSSSPAPIPSPTPQPVVARQVTGAVVDVATGALVSAATTVTARDASGNLSTVTRNARGEVASSFTASGGVVSFAVAGDAALPVTLTLVADSAGYLAGMTRVTIASALPVEFSIPMTSQAAPPQGAVALQEVNGSTNSSGTTPAPIAVATTPQPTTQGATQVQVPQGTTILSASGQPLSGNLTWEVTYFDPVTPSSLAAFPGGLNVPVPATPGGSATPTPFVTAGFTNLQVTDTTGRAASTFNPAIDVTVFIPPGLVNPRTKLPYAANDPVDVLSFTETTGQWRNEGTNTVQFSPGSGLFVTQPVTHFTNYSVGSLITTTCDVTVRTSQLYSTRLTLNVYGQAGGYQSTGHDLVAGAVLVPGLPADVALDLQVVDSSGAVIGSLAVPNACASTPAEFTVTVPAPPAPQVGNLSVLVQKQCIENAQLVTPQGSATVVVQQVVTPPPGSTAPPADPLIKTTGTAGTAEYLALPVATFDVTVTLFTGEKLGPVQKSVTLNQTTSYVASFPVQCQAGPTGGSGGTN